MDAPDTPEKIEAVCISRQHGGKRGYFAGALANLIALSDVISNKSVMRTNNARIKKTLCSVGGKAPSQIGLLLAQKTICEKRGIA